MVTIEDLAGQIEPLDRHAVGAARERHDGLAKPPGSLGRLEDLGARLSGIARTCPPPVPDHPWVVIAAGDHGVHAQGVTPWPQAITGAMVRQFALGTASVSAIAATVGAQVMVLDVGLVGDPHPADGAAADGAAGRAQVRSLRIRPGTDDLMVGPAMSRQDAVAAVLAGAREARQLIDAGADLLVTGDMGIASTTASSCLVAAFTEASADAVLGRGAAIDDTSHARKREVIAEALVLHETVLAEASTDPIGVLAAVGGLEHAALVGMILEAAGSRIPVLLDGVITNAAALAAQALAPDAVEMLIASHRSTEPAAGLALAQLGLDPLLDLELRLGEGTGGLLAVPLVQAAARVLRDVARVADL